MMHRYTMYWLVTGITFACLSSAHPPPLLPAGSPGVKLQQGAVQ